MRLVCRVATMASLFIFNLSMGVENNAPPVKNIIAADSTEVQRDLVRRVRERFGNRVEIFINRNGVITGMRNLIIGGNSPDEIVNLMYGFLERNADLLGLANPRQELQTTMVSLPPQGYGIFEMKQVVNGIGIVNSGLHIETGEENRFLSDIYFDIFPNARNLDTTPTIDSLQAMSIARARYAGDDTATWAGGAELQIANFADGLHLIWRLGVVGASIVNSREYSIDAHNGAVLKVESAYVE